MAKASPLEPDGQQQVPNTNRRCLRKLTRNCENVMLEQVQAAASRALLASSVAACDVVVFCVIAKDVALVN